MTNNLRGIKKGLCAFAKKCKGFKYTDSVLITFLITGTVSVSSNLFSAEKDGNIEKQKQIISTDIKDFNALIKKTRRENNKLLKNANLELIQLMEQGDHVVKSPWSSWQYGINGFYNNWIGTYKGRGDKSTKYPYEGVYIRSTNIFGRSTTARTADQKAILNSIVATSGGFSLDDIGLNYGLIGRAQINEDPISIEISARIRPKNIQKGAITLSVSPVNVIQPSPSVTLGITNTPAAPNISISSFSPVAPKVEAPSLPVPPTFAVVVGADCNTGCSSSSNTPRQNTKPGFNLNNRAAGNVDNILHYTWPVGTGPYRLPGERASLAFKMYAETRKNFTLGTDKPRDFSGSGGGSGSWGSTTVAPTNVYFNSYNFGDEYINAVRSSANGTNPNKNNQYFFVGGSRFIESDDVYPGGNTLTIPNGYTVNLGGILTLGLVSQGHKTTQLNAGTITDKEEKNDNWIKNMPYDTSGAGAGKYLTIKGPTEDYYIKRSTDGYVGYKVALALIQEDTVHGGTIINDTTGVIDFRGERSIGLYTYLPNPSSVHVYSNRPMINKGSILLSGAESYGMKYAATEVAGTVDFVNDQNANITLRKNPDGSDKADNAAAMALMRDNSVTTKVTLTRGKAVNKGNINLEDNISNALGMFVNIDSNMINEGTIKVSAVAPKVSDKYQFNVAMRADQADLTYEGASAGNTEVINKKDIKLTGQGAMGMIANGSSTSGANTKYAIATNDAGATIELNKEGTADSKDNFAMLATNKAEVVNKGTIKIGDSKGSVGMAALKQGSTHSTAKNEGSIIIDGDKATGVYNTGHFLMDNPNAKISVKGDQSIGLYAKETDTTDTKTELKQGTVKSENGAVALYSDQADITLDNTSGNLKLIAGKGGLLFYNYKSSNPDQYAGQFTLKGTVKPEIEAGGYGFYLKNATINNVSGQVQGVPAFLDAMFNLTPSAQKLKVNMQAGGTFMVLHKPTGGSIKLSSVNSLSSINSALGTKVQLVAPTTGSYKIYSVYRGKLAINQDVNLDNDDSTATPDAFYRVDFRSSNIVLDATKTIAGTKQGQVALFQGNYDEGTAGNIGTVGDVSIVNNGTINLTGDSIISGPAANRKTTTAMAGDFITLTNNKTIKVTGNNGIGIYGAGGSKILNSAGGSVTVGQEGVALYGANKLNSSTLGDGTISVTNAGDIKGVSGKTKAFGIFAENTSAVGNSVLTNSGTIDFSSSQESIGIHSINSTVSNTGEIKMGLKGVAVNTKNSDINSTGDIVLAGNGIAFNLGGSFTGRTLNFSSKVTLNGDGNSIFNLKDMSFSSVGASLTENVSVVPNGKSFAYFSLDNSSLIYDKNKVFSGNKITLVSAKNSTVDWRSNVTLNGEENIAFYMNGRKTGAAFELQTAVGKTVALGNKSVGAYGINGARIENNSDIVIGSDGAALYSTGVNGSLKNTGKLTLGKNSVGMFMKDGTALINIGEIVSTEAGAKGLVVNNTTASVYANNGKIKLDGTSSIGIHAEGAAHTIISAADVEVGDTTGTDQSVAIHLKDGGQVRVLSNTSVKSGNNSIGIYGSTILTTVENNAEVKVGDGAIGIYAKSGNIDLDAGSKMKIGETLGANKEAVGVYYIGNAGTINNNLASFDIGKGSIGIVDAGTGATTINNNLASVNLKGDSVYNYTSNTNSNVIGNTVITSAGNGNYGYYVAGNLENYGAMDLSSGTGNVGIYSAYGAGAGNGIARNYANIKVGKTDLENELYSIGMAAGYTNKDRPSENKVGHIINMAGSTITVGNKNSIGMYASGAGSTAENYGTIHVTAKKGIGMYLESGATGINRAGGLIEIDAAAQNAIAVYSTGTTTVFKNYGTIRINAPGSKGIVTANGANNNAVAGNIDVQNSSAEAIKNIEGTAGGDKVFGDKTLSVPRGGLTDSKIKDSDGNIITPTVIDTTSATATAEIQVSNDPIAKATYNRDILKEHEDFGSVSKIGMYVDTSGVSFTNPIEGLNNLTGLKEADLIVGAEASEYTNAKTITVGKNILKRYNNALLNSGVDKWNILSGSLTWAAVPLRLNGNGEIQGVIMTKVDYKEFAKNSTIPYNFLDGLEQRYDMNALDSREKRVFNKLNSIGKNEPILLSQAYDEMMGHQYANVQQRTYGTGRIIDKEISHLSKEWDTKSKQSNKIKMFGMRDEYKTDTAGIIDYTSNAYGFAYLHEDETVKLGNSSGWYAGAVHNRFKFKDIGGSKENQTMLKLGVFKTMSPAKDHNGSLQWTISGEGYVSRNDMHRKYLVVDEIFNAKSDYTTYGVAVKNELGYNIRTSERTSIRPYGGLKLEYGRFSNIKEKSGEMRLDVKGNDYYSVKPELGVEFNYRQPMAVKTTFVTSLGLGYENELGKVGDVKNKARVSYTEADWFNIRGEKDDRKGNFKADLNIGVENQRFGVTLNGGYDTKGKNVRGGIGFRAIY